jgi:hypothetical protein
MPVSRIVRYCFPSSQNREVSTLGDKGGHLVAEFSRAREPLPPQHRGVSKGENLCDAGATKELQKAAAAPEVVFLKQQVFLLSKEERWDAELPASGGQQRF